MPLDLSRFVHTRPRLYHLTASPNVELIQVAGRLRPTAEILADAGEIGRVRERRRESQIVHVNGHAIHIRDQAPLHAGNMAVADGWTFDDFIAHLNEHVFFWPGTGEGPIDYGRRHFERYANEDCLVLVLDTAAVVAANPGQTVRFCRYNSGSPRCAGGKPSPRGPRTFQPAHEYEGTPSSVVEVTFRGPVVLPSHQTVVQPRTLI